ncbi:MAG: inositol monophosphatase [Melioribacteraceae bacterium]|nr:inositol monophosphatase [Melioribacteraceae bacterium]
MINNIIEVSKLAGEVIRNGFNQNFEIEYKTNSSNLVTEIDKKSEELIIDYVKKNYPSHGILAEESGEKGLDSEYKWIIDPLDGTTNFAHGLPIFSVSIGVIKGKEIIAGVIYDVMSDVLYSTEKGSGSFRNGSKISVNKRDDIKTSLLVTGFPYDIAENPLNAIEHFNEFLLNSRAVRRLGSAAIDFCYVASGVFDGFWEVTLQPWDICAGKLMVEEAGGKVTDFVGNNYEIIRDSKDSVSSNGFIHDKMIEILRKNSK